MGIFVYRSKTNVGRGPVCFSDVTLRWPGAGSLSLPIELWVHALDMVYVAEGAFEIGDPRGPKGPACCFHDHDRMGVFPIKSEEEIDVLENAGDTLAGQAKRLVWSNSGQAGDRKNIWEFTVTVGNDRGRAFDGTHGDGQLDGSGLPAPDNYTWPDFDARGVGFRGGSWYTKKSLGRVADRAYATGIHGYMMRSHDTGVRCVRSAPKDSGVR